MSCCEIDNYFHVRIFVLQICLHNKESTLSMRFIERLRFIIFLICSSENTLGRQYQDSILRISKFWVVEFLEIQVSIFSNIKTYKEDRTEGKY